MRTFTTLLFAFVFGQLIAQGGFFPPDTLLVEPVIGDPTESMLPEPSGADELWINFDDDMAEGFCVEGTGDTPMGWFIERDFGFLDPNDTDNDCFTSCSYLDNGVRNKNWLILPPLNIPDDSYTLCWRSLVSEGPAFADGYRVLASTASNLPSSNDFSHELFRAAEMIKPNVPNVYTLNAADYVFSPGYIHANGFTDTNYFFILPPNGPLRGRLEPHCVSLADFAGQTIYLAFLHDSKDDSQLQIDDILVSNTVQVATGQPDNFVTFNIMPNPVTSSTYVNWTMQKPESGQLQLLDMTGKLLLEKSFSAYEQGQLFLDLKTLHAGVYQCVVQTASGRAAKRLVKL